MPTGHALPTEACGPKMGGLEAGHAGRGEGFFSLVGFPQHRPNCGMEELERRALGQQGLRQL